MHGRILTQLYVLLFSSGKPIRIDFSSDRGNFPGEVTFEKWELLFPLCISVLEFNGLKRRLGGFHENSCSLVRQHPEQDGLVVKSILERVNVYVVDTAETPNDAGSVTSEYLFAGCYRKDMVEEKMLISVTCR